jgi:MFS family permease
MRPPARAGGDSRKEAFTDMPAFARAAAHPRFAQAIVVAAEFMATTLWFSASSVSGEIADAAHLTAEAPLDLASPVQIGFVVGTLTLGLVGLGDVFRASRLFASSAMIGAIANTAIAFTPESIRLVLFCRLVTGVALAGIYPVGMKLAIGWNPGSAKRILAWLVGMLTLGTAAPHLIRFVNLPFDWRAVLFVSSALAAVGGLLVFLTGDSTLSTPGGLRTLRLGALLRQFQRRSLATVALSYLGHMWELYAFWALVPVLAQHALELGGTPAVPVSLYSFGCIAIGALACVAGGLASERLGSDRVAAWAMWLSALMCLIAPVVTNGPLFFLCLMICGFFVIADSPQLSALAVEACDRDQIASTLALLNGAGFLITVASIQLCTQLWPVLGPAVSWILLPGPCLGAFCLSRRRKPT